MFTIIYHNTILTTNVIFKNTKPHEIQCTQKQWSWTFKLLTVWWPSRQAEKYHQTSMYPCISIRGKEIITLLCSSLILHFALHHFRNPWFRNLVFRIGVKIKVQTARTFLEFSIPCFDKHTTISLYNFPQFNNWDNQWWGDYKVKNHKSKARGKELEESSCQNTQTRMNRPNTCIMRLHINFDNQHYEGNSLLLLAPKSPKPTPTRTTMI